MNVEALIRNLIIRIKRTTPMESPLYEDFIGNLTNEFSRFYGKSKKDKWYIQYSPDYIEISVNTDTWVDEDADLITNVGKLFNKEFFFLHSYFIRFVEDFRNVSLYYKLDCDSWVEEELLSYSIFKGENYIETQSALSIMSEWITCKLYDEIIQYASTFRIEEEDNFLDFWKGKDDFYQVCTFDKCGYDTTYCQRIYNVKTIEEQKHIYNYLETSNARLKVHIYDMVNAYNELYNTNISPTSYRFDVGKTIGFCEISKYTRNFTEEMSQNTFFGWSLDEDTFGGAF